MRTNMKWLKRLILGVMTVNCALGAGSAIAADVYPTAILDFQERGRGVAGYGEKVSDIMVASLMADPNLLLVDRQEMQKILNESELTLSGMADPNQATQVGQLIGAKIIVTGSVMQVGKKLYLVAKIIGTETSRVLGESVKGDQRDDLDNLVEELGAKVAETVKERAGELVAKAEKTEDLIAALKQTLGSAKRPTVFVEVAEHHVGQRATDPAAQTEIMRFCKETGFVVIDPTTGNSQQADIVIKGEGFSEFAMRHGNLVSVKARLEIKAIGRDNEVVATDRQTAVVVDLTEQIAGKTALQRAAAQIATRLLPKLAGK